MTTVNRGYATPAHGSEVDTWDVPLNDNFGLIDANLGGVTSISLSSSPVVLSAAQYKNGTIRFTGNLTASCLITFPPVSGWWTIDNQTTGNFFVLLSCLGAQNIAVPQGVATDIFTDGSNVKFRSLAPFIGAYVDYGGASIPNWVAACTVPPLLNCDGSTFSAGTYPHLFTVLGTTILPDLRGRNRSYLNGGTDRINSSRCGIDGNTRFSSGGADVITLSVPQLPTFTPSFSVAPTYSFTDANTLVSVPGGALTQVIGTLRHTPTLVTDFTFASIGNGSSHINMPPTAIGGITMIRAA